MRLIRRNHSTEPIRVLLRRADAGPPRRPAVLDEWRGLTALGHAQAVELSARLGWLPIQRVLSSPSLRCRQTVVPLARRLGLEVEPCRLLASDADPAKRAEFLRHPETANAVLCTHRTALLDAFAHLTAAGAAGEETLADPAPATAWTLYGGPQAPVRVSFLPAHATIRAVRPSAHAAAAAPYGLQTPG
jgi:broad specificity phosphatase PhoE